MVKIIDVSTLKKRIKDSDFDEEQYEASISQNLKANHGKVAVDKKSAGSGSDKD